MDMTPLDGGLVILGIFGFLAGIGGTAVFIRLKAIFEHGGYRTNGAVVEAVVLDYTRRLRDYDKVIAELRSKIEILESKIKSQEIMSSDPSQAQPHVALTSEPVTVTRYAANEKEVNSTTDYIFKLLVERPRSSREVQLAIGRTREHTARLMKKLHNLGLVSRDINTKPFRYTITDAGREMLKERTEPASVAV
jgi:hypothetical protein